MDLVEIAVMGLFSLMVVGGVVATVAVYIFWKNAKITQLQRQLNGLLNIMEDYMYTFDREQGQMWEYTLMLKDRLVHELARLHSKIPSEGGPQ